MITLTHARITLALHELKGGGGRPLLHLHGLGLRSPDTLPDDLASWSGPVYALDFTGHGASTVPRGGGYTPETLMGDVDAAVQHLVAGAAPLHPGGDVTIVGRGLGAYVALLTSAARADAVRGAILCDGPGLAGGGPVPGTPTIVRIDPEEKGPPDPFAIAELSKDVRPPDYAVDMARLALSGSARANPIAICARARPDWLVAVAEELGTGTTALEDALRTYASA